jgi:hypothetical protein
LIARPERPRVKAINFPTFEKSDLSYPGDPFPPDLKEDLLDESPGKLNIQPQAEDYKTDQGG